MLLYVSFLFIVAAFSFVIFAATALNEGRFGGVLVHTLIAFWCITEAIVCQMKL